MENSRRSSYGSNDSKRICVLKHKPVGTTPSDILNHRKEHIGEVRQREISLSSVSSTVYTDKSAIDKETGY